MLVLLAALEHDLKGVALALQEVRVLEGEGELQLDVDGSAGRERDLVGAQSALRRLHLHRQRHGGQVAA